jgi:nucleotide-binding universal stress UspA family protein
MTIIVGFAPRPEGRAALLKGIEIAKRRKEHLMVVNATPGKADDEAMAGVQDVEYIEKLLVQEGISAEFKQFGRGKSAVEEIQNLVDSLDASLLVIGIRRRSAVGKFILGSVAQELLMSVNCPVLSVKAGMA